MMSDLDLKEQRHVRVGLKILRRRIGNWETVAKAIRRSYDNTKKVANGQKTVSATTAFRVSQLLEVTFDDLLAGTFVTPGTCLHCGRRVDFADEDTVVEPVPARRAGGKH